MIKNEGIFFSRTKKLPVLSKVKKDFKWNLDRTTLNPNQTRFGTKKKRRLVNCSVELEYTKAAQKFNGILVSSQRPISCAPDKKVRFVDDIKTNPRSLIPSPLYRALDKGEILRSFVTAIKYENLKNFEVIKRNANCIRSLYKC